MRGTTKQVSYWGDFDTFVVSDVDFDIVDSLVMVDQGLMTHFFGSHASMHLEVYDGTAWTDLNSAEGTATIAVVNEWVNVVAIARTSTSIGGLRMVTGADNQIGRIAYGINVKTEG